jgi:hypothetical protein
MALCSLCRPLDLLPARFRAGRSRSRHYGALSVIGIWIYTVVAEAEAEGAVGGGIGIGWLQAQKNVPFPFRLSLSFFSPFSRPSLCFPPPQFSLLTRPGGVN